MFLKVISPEIINFINQTEEIFNYNNVDNLQTIYHYSVPTVKLSYPEPFIASASFMHSDLWFIHILVYQYWLWFVFVFIIVFFFITFVCTIRWCNMRVKPRRETRGVSRSKCGDLITACVPVSWATSIIVSESTDAIDYFDGFGTTELVVGIRAYQWGWEYYYPKDIDLNYNIKKNYSAFIGNSLKYNKVSDVNISSNNLWKFYQNKNFDQIVTPAYIFLLPLDNSKILNYLNFNDVGANPIYESNAFKKIKTFSKSHSSDLFFNPNFKNNFSKKLFFFYGTELNYLDAYLYGLKRQQNFLSNAALLNSNENLFNKNSLNKIINFSFSDSLNTNQNISLITKKNNSLVLNSLNNDFSLVRGFFLIDKKNFNKEKFLFTNFSIFNSYLSIFNINSDKKQLNLPYLKIFNLQNKSIQFNKSFFFSALDNNKESDVFFNFDALTAQTKNFDKKFLNSNAISSNQSVSLTNRNIRNFLTIGAESSLKNHSFDANTVSVFKKNLNKKLNPSSFSIFNWFNLDLLNTDTVSKLLPNRISADYPHSPVMSNNPYVSFLDYDSFKNTLVENTPTILQGKEELMPNFLSNIYWNFYWSNSTIEWKLANSFLYSKINKFLYLPAFTFYYDYDFRNWQSLELLEDSYWESIYSIYTLDEYLSLAKDFYNHHYLEKTVKNYLNLNKNFSFKSDVIAQSYFKNKTDSGEFYMTNFYLDDCAYPTFLIKTKDFFIFPTVTYFNSMEDNYENFKFLFYSFSNLNNNLSLLFSNFLKPVLYSTVLDFFRSDFDEFAWFFDDNNNFFKNFFWKKNLLNYNDLVIIPNESKFLNNRNNRFSNYINLRNTAKNSIVTHNAIQKVFKTRFDENRSHTKLNDFSNFFVSHPFITSSKTPYEQMLGKNKESYFSTNFYRNKTKLFFNNFYSMNTSLNYYFYDFPFLMALKSDASRYIWFDWYAKWGFYEVQPSSSSRYAVFGMPYFTKNFEFNSLNNENFIETETYLTRISRARKNYLPNWIYTPYFFAKNNYWYKNNIFNQSLFFEVNSITVSKFLLSSMSWYWKDVFFLNYSNLQFFPSNSNTNTYSNSGWKPQTSIQGYFFQVTKLIDILTKREYLYRELLLKNNKIVSLPNDLTASNTNSLLNEIKINFLFFNSIGNSSEYSKQVFYSSLNYFNLMSINPLLNEIKETLNLKNFSNFFLFYFFNFDKSNFNNSSLTEIDKNQYRPMRKGITNMIRLHATGAMALPIEIRLQILASSKDVIHSWAIPSAGIKIDCVPGYSSHRVMIFLVSGIFWGQCMEVCGRYHHWMPIIVYFMKRDLFFLWCTHFIFLSGSNNMWNINDRQYTNYVRYASFNKNSWLSELSLN